ncbi:DCC1-like thiol-disulfide oxidoreductase family protein [Pedobacter aquatilis]|uniref:thiol-disulfide oxidoreductase DCC family protein n=1 Tax=Pedobacter aquatilis TaxID=351343 RepID=UPI0025B57D92|nr:DCC1-like thiol-disulfide oxidoreductase family protein [Pedobacter aquatilis]MDN3586932.1 DCC1-like thiol-disulfide oxidoreductase family protein [Pedobacter aquatilis]
MNTQPVIFFDGVCNLCNASVQFVIKRDKHKHFQFTALQGKFAEEILPQSVFNSNQINSILLLEGGMIYQKSSAALRIAKKLNGFWPLIYGFIIVPRFIRDWVYDIIAKNRYKWWGKQESCWVPIPALKSRFYD